MKIAIVTGASSGMGREFVRQLDKCMQTIDEIWVIARRVDKLESLKEEVSNIPIRVLALDISKKKDITTFSNMLAAEKPEVRLLVHSAGVGYAGRFDEILRADAEEMTVVNDVAVVSITHVLLNYMTCPSNIIILASASAFLPQKEFAIYAASKAYILYFSRALNAELKNKGVCVTAVCPGPVDTEFLNKCNDGRKEKLLKKLVKVKPEPVVKKALIDAKAGKDISVYGIPMKLVHIASKILPSSLMLKFM